MEQEISKLLNVLTLFWRAARYAEWTRSASDATQFCVVQYNRILARLGVLEPAIKPLFTPLNESASPEVIRMAARELIAYFEVDEPESEMGMGIGIGMGCGPRGRRGPRVRWAPFSAKCD